ncbi:MAG: polysaccharide deacetylase family protein [Gallionellaceae bacterium]|nr:polysaccharide deacetylase family protein [Gallionellaceae bacterium]
MKQLALKIDVDTYRGTREGVPRLMETLKRHNAQATFFFSLGPDHTGRAIWRVFRPGFLGKVSRTSVLEHYGIKTLLYGTLLPGPDIGRNCAGIMRAVRDAGFEVGIHCHDHIRWQDHVAGRDAEWTRRELQRAVDRFTEIFGEAPRAHAAAGWQMNRHALRLTQRLDFDYSSDTRGTHPFIPTWNAEIIACPQLPTTLPTLDELIGRDGITPDTVAQYLLHLTEDPPACGGVAAQQLGTHRRTPCGCCGHVYTLHAELEGGKLLPVFEQLLAGWKAQGYELVSLRQYLEGLNGALPRHEVVTGEIAGRSGTLAVQGS